MTVGAVGLLLATLVEPAASPDASAPQVTDTAKQTARVVLVVFGDDALAHAVSPSVRAQLADVPAELVVVRATDPGLGVGQRVFPATEAANRAQAMAAFWIEVSESGDLLLHLVEHSGARALTRRVPRTEEGEAAAHAAVATIVRAATAGLLAGEEIGMSPVAPAPTPGPPVAAPVLPRSRTPIAPVELPAPRRVLARLAVAYRAGPHARELGGAWHGGLQVDVGIQHAAGLFLGVGYTLLPPLSGVVDGPPTQEGQALVVVQRHPVGVAVGRQWIREHLAVELAVRGELEIQRASISSQALFQDTQPEPEIGLEGSIEPQVQFLLRPTPSFGVFLGSGVSFFFPRDPPPGVDWVEGGGETVHRTVYLRAYPVRPVLRLGILAWL